MVHHTAADQAQLIEWWPPDMKVPTLAGINFEEYDLAFTASVSRNNDLIGNLWDWLLKPDSDGNFNASWNSRKEKIKFCNNLQVQVWNDDKETIYILLVQYVGTSETGINTVSRHTRSKNVRKCNIELRGHFKTEANEDTKASKANTIL